MGFAHPEWLSTRVLRPKILKLSERISTKQASISDMKDS